MKPWYSLDWLSPLQWQQYRFAYPLALWGIPALVLLFLLRYYLHQQAQQRLNISLGPLYVPLSGNRPQRLGQSVLRRLRYLLPLSVFIGVSFILIALARPQIVREQREEDSEGIDIMLAMDVSDSMTETDLPPTRLAAARRVAQSFVNGRKNDRIGLVVFAGEAYSLCPLTTDYALIKQYLSELNAQMVRTSGTAIGDALARCIVRMRDPLAPVADTTRRDSLATAKERSKVIILLSDGDNTAGNLDPLTASRLARAFSIKIYTIAVGRPVAAPNEAVTVDEGILKTIATTGNGSFYRASDARRLRAIFAEINRLERAPIRIRVYQDVQDYYRIYLCWAIACLLVGLLLKNTIFGNVLED